MILLDSARVNKFDSVSKFRSDVIVEKRSVITNDSKLVAKKWRSIAYPSNRSNLDSFRFVAGNLVMQFPPPPVPGQIYPAQRGGPCLSLGERKKKLIFRTLFSNETYFVDLSLNIASLFPCTSLCTR